MSPDGTVLASGGVEGRIELWDVASKQRIAALEGHKDQVLHLSFSRHGKTLVSGSSDGTILLWDIAPYIAPPTPNPDFDGNGVIGFSDFLEFASKFGLSRGDKGYHAQFDLDGDGAVGFGDFVIFAAAFGQKAPST